jgi:MFS transporter, DHA1 family, multidrug resistance protein
VQGVAASAGMVLSRTLIRDLTSSAATVRALAVVAAGTGVLYVFAPVLGGVLLAWLGWRGPLLLVVVFSAVVLLVAAIAVPETLPPAARDPGPIRPRLLLRHLRNRPFVAFLGVQAMSYGALMACVSASPFVFTGVLGVSATDYGVLFALNQVTAVVLSVGSVAALRRVRAEWVPVAGLAVSSVGVAATAAGFVLHAPLPVMVVSITASMATLALNNAPLTGMGLNHVAVGTGAAAALCGCAQFVTGAVVTPLVGLAGSGTPWPYLGTMAVLLVGAGALLAVTLRRLRAAQDPAVDLELGEAVAQV